MNSVDVILGAVSDMVNPPVSFLPALEHCVLVSLGHMTRFSVFLLCAV